MNVFHLLLNLLLLAATPRMCTCSSTASTTLTANNNTHTHSSSSALEQARQLNAPLAKLTKDGHMEHSQFWNDHEILFKKAFDEYGKLNEDLYHFNDEFMEKYLDPTLKEAFQKKSYLLLSKLVHETNVKGVYSIQIFNPTFVQKLQEELIHYESSGIPIRRPNSMNRHGLILSTIGMDDFITGLTNDILKVLARYILREYANPEDLVEHYAFTVKYGKLRGGTEKGGGKERDNFMDSNLSLHTDHSTITVNICLENTQNEKALYFQPMPGLQNGPICTDDPILHDNGGHEKKNNNNNAYLVHHGEDDMETKKHFVTLSTPGMALFHLGQHKHGVMDVHGQRSQLVIWMYGKDGYVRIAPYEEHEIAPLEWMISKTNIVV